MEIKKKRIHMVYDIFFNCNWVLTPGGSSTVHIYTQTIHRTTQSIQTIYIEQHNMVGGVLFRMDRWMEGRT